MANFSADEYSLDIGYIIYVAHHIQYYLLDVSCWMK